MNNRIILFLLSSICFTQLMIGQDISENEIRENKIHKITSYYKEIPFDYSEELDISLIDSSQIVSIREFDKSGRIIKNTSIYDEDITTVETYDYKDSIYISKSENDSSLCMLGSKVHFNEGLNFNRTIGMQCDGERVFIYSGSNILNRFKTQNVILLDSSEISKEIHYQYDSENQIVNLYSEHKHVERKGQKFLIYDNSFRLIKAFAINDQGEEEKWLGFITMMNNCNNDNPVTKINAKNKIYKNKRNLELQIFSKLILEGKNRSHVYTYEYTYREY